MIYFITICLNGMPFLPIQLATFNRLRIRWKWIVIEGTAKPLGCTSWCAEMPPGMSSDGSHEWLTEVARNHPNVVHRYSIEWKGKLPMFQEAASIIHELDNAVDQDKTRVVMEIDADELWQPEQLDRIYRLFDTGRHIERMQFLCRYFVGPNIVVVSKNTYGNHEAYEWRRAWRYAKDFQFTRHEAPETTVDNRGYTLRAFNHYPDGRLTFDHQAYFYESQVAHKERYYKYPGAVEEWRRLQANTTWPVKARDFLSWIKDETVLDVLHTARPRSFSSLRALIRQTLRWRPTRR
jgi:hypothetical protein